MSDKVILIGCAVVALWMALLAAVHFSEGNITLGAVFTLLTLLNANSVVVTFRRMS